MALQDLTPQLRTRLSRMERAVGWFVLLATVLLLFGFCYYVYQTAERKGWFLRKARYYTYIERASGLKVGDPVTLMGFPAGQIASIKPMPAWDYDHDVYVEFDIIEPNYGYLWTQGSRAKINAADLLGKRSLEVTRGTNGYATCVSYPYREISLSDAGNLPDLAKWHLAQEVYDSSQTNLVFRANISLTQDVLAKLAGLRLDSIRVIDTRQEKRSLTAVWDNQKGLYEPFNGKNLYELKNDEAPAVTERLEKLVNEVETALPNILSLTNRIAFVLDNAANLASNLDALTLSARPVITNLAAATTGLDRPGGLGEWLLPTNLNNSLQQTLAGANSALASANTTISSANTNLTELATNLMRSLDNLADITSNLSAQVRANTNMLSSISETIIHTDDFIQGLKHHWLLRSAFKTKATNAPPSLPRKSLRSPKDARD